MTALPIIVLAAVGVFCVLLMVLGASDIGSKSGASADAGVGDEQEIYDDAALKQLWGKVRFLNGVMGDISADETARVRAGIAEKRKWVDSLTDRRWRKAFHRWLDHAEYCCKEADKYRARRPAENARRAKDQEKRRATKAAARDLLAKSPPA